MSLPEVINYHLLFFCCISIFGVFCLILNAQIRDSNLGKRITWYLIWASLMIMTIILSIIWVKISKLKGG